MNGNWFKRRRANGKRGNGVAAGDGAALIELHEVVKVYQTAAGGYTALKSIDLQIGCGEFVAVIGRSGSGKSTLINMITGIDRPTSGQVRVAERRVEAMSENAIARWRGRNLGVVFQFFQLLPNLTVIENVMLPMDFCKTYRRSQRRARALELLALVDMAGEADKLPSALSGGQQQRVAIARALANDPALIVADEPTGNLDSKTAAVVFALFERLAAQGKTIVMVTHDSSLAQRVGRTVLIVDGEVVNEYVVRALPALPPQLMLEASHQAQPLSFPAGATVLSDLAPSQNFYIVTQGTAEVLLTRPGGSDVLVERLGPGQGFGELSLLETPRTLALVRAADAGPLELLALDGECFRSLLAGSPEFRDGMQRAAESRSARHLAAVTAGE